MTKYTHIFFNFTIKNRIFIFCSGLNCAPHKRYIHIQIPGSTSCNLTWKKDLCKCNEVKVVDMTSPCIIWVGPKSSDRRPSKRQTRRPTDTEEKVMWRWRQKLEWCSHKPRGQGMPRAIRSWKKLGTESPPRDSEEGDRTDSLTLDFWPPDLWENKSVGLCHQVCDNLLQ